MKKLTKRILSAVLAAVLCLSVMPFAFAASIRGDANFDGSVNSTDALVILKYSVGKEIEVIDEYLLDLNGDGQINSSDALRALKISVGSDDPLTYDQTELIKYYCDAVVTADLETKSLEYISDYKAKVTFSNLTTLETKDVEGGKGSTPIFTDGYDDEGYTPAQYLPIPDIDPKAISSSEIKKVDGGYVLNINLCSEQVNDQAPIPENHYMYAGNYVDCTDVMLDGYSLVGAQASFDNTSITVNISDEGYIQNITVKINFKVTTYTKLDGPEYRVMDIIQEGALTDTYTFTY